MLNNIEKGDVVVIKDSSGQTHTVTVLSVKVDYDHSGSFVRFDYLNHSEASPMRRTAYPKELLQILRKNTTPKLDPKVQRPGDFAPPGHKGVVIDGKMYVEKVPGAEAAVPFNAEANPQVHQAVQAPAKPVTSRIKKAAIGAK